MSVYQPGDFVWSLYDGEWFEAEIEEMEEEGVYRVYYHEYDDSVPGTPLHDIKDWQEGETEPPPDGPNQANAPEYTEEEYAEEEYAEEEYVEEVPETSAVVEDDGGARLAKKRAEADKVAREKKAAEAKAKADARVPTKAKDSRLFDAAQQAERRKSQKREELDAEFSFAPKMATRRASNGGAKSSNRTSALYEHGKNKQQAELRRSSSDVQDTHKEPRKTKAATKETDERVNRLYQAGKEREMRRLQKEDAEKEISQRSSNSASYDARMGFDKSNTGLGQDLVTTGARTNALYHEAQMRAAKKEQARVEAMKAEKAGGFQPKLASKKGTASSPRAKGEKSDVASRLYNDGVSRSKKMEQKKMEKEWGDESHSFAPDISASQRNCESSSLPGARHEALFMQGEVQRMKRDEMLDNYVDGKEVDDLTFTPAVNYHYNDELLAHDTSDFTERLYRTDFAGSKQREEENADYRDHQFEECTFSPEIFSRKVAQDEDGTGESRIDKLYKDAEKANKKKEETRQAIEKQESSRKLTLATAKKNKYADEDEYKQPVHERLFGSHKKALEEKEKLSSAKPKASFRPKLFTSKKSREVSTRQSSDLYLQGVEKLAQKREMEKSQLPLELRLAEEEAAKHSFKPQLATKKKKKSGVTRDNMNPMMMRMDSGDSVSSEMSEMTIDSRRSSFSKQGMASSTENLKKAAGNSVRTERSAALQGKAAELLAKRAAARKAAAEAKEAENTF